PPLRDSEWVTGGERTLIRIALHGVKGKIEIGDAEWNSEMPGHGHMADQDLAAALSYLRRAFGHEASLVTDEQVAAERKACGKRNEPWTAAELLDNQ
ncbi:MAG: cytochrome c, partial [Planctomycetes bacterium]|nr:cytochrome c [Planctomycetota bacterium]